MNKYTVIIVILVCEVRDCDNVLARKVIISSEQIWILIEQMGTGSIKYCRVCSKFVFISIVFLL